MKINSIIDLVKDLDTSRQTKNLNKLLIRILLHLQVEFSKEGNETVTICHGLKMLAADGEMRLTDVADTQKLLRLIQSIPSPKAEPFKLWMAQVAAERLDQMQDPELPLTKH